MSRRAFVPPELSERPFRGSRAVAAGLLTRHQLESKVWARITRDVYVRADRALDEQVRRDALRLVCGPTTVVCGLTAAWIYGAWTPPPGRPVPLEMTRPVRAPGTTVAGIDRRRLVLRGTPDLVREPTGISVLDQDVVVRDGLAVTSPTRTCFDLMRLRRLVEAVAVADAFASVEAIELPTLATYCADRRRWPGVRRARTAVMLSSPRSRSPGESRLRMVIVLSGLILPLVNQPIVDSAGEVLAIPDLLVARGPGLAIDYDGAYHDEGEQPVRDRRRATRFVSETEIPLVSYDRHDLRLRKEEIVRTVARKTSQRPLCPLDDVDFLRTPYPRAR